MSAKIRQKQSAWTINRILEEIVFKSYNRQFNSRYKRLVQLRYLMQCKSSLKEQESVTYVVQVCFPTLCTMNAIKL